MENYAKKNDEIELLKLEYQECQNGYNSRDSIAHDEFFKLIQVFSIFFTILVAFNIFVEISLLFHHLICIVIGLAGTLSLFSILLVIQSNSNCKVALRKRCIEIEKRLQTLVGFHLRYWQVIDGRSKHFEEKIFKGKPGQKRDIEERERNVFVNAVRIFIVLWLVIVFSMIVWGNSIKLHV